MDIKPYGSSCSHKVTSWESETDGKSKTLM